MAHNDKLLRTAEVRERLGGISHSTFLRRVRKHPRFPQPVQAIPGVECGEDFLTPRARDRLLQILPSVLLASYTERLQTNATVARLPEER